MQKLGRTCKYKKGLKHIADTKVGKKTSQAYLIRKQSLSDDLIEPHEFVKSFYIIIVFSEKNEYSIKS